MCIRIVALIDDTENKIHFLVILVFRRLRVKNILYLHECLYYSKVKNNTEGMSVTNQIVFSEIILK